MFAMRRLTEQDRAFWLAMVPSERADGFARKLRDGLGYVLLADERPVGVLCYQLFWEELPFLCLLRLDAPCRGRGYGRAAMNQWEEEMRTAGYRMVLTSTQVNEGAQHFYRKLGYKDCGCLVLDEGPLAQPMEMFMSKLL